MANIKELKKRIKSIRGTHKTTSAMKLVSTSKYSRHKSMLEFSTVFNKSLLATYQRASAVEQEEVERAGDHVLLVLSSTKGLCGPYNSRLAAYLREFLTVHSQKHFKIYIIGNKLKAFLDNSLRQEIIELEDFPLGNMFFKNDFLQNIFSHFRGNRITGFTILYNYFDSVLSYTSKELQVLPIESPQKIEEGYTDECNIWNGTQDDLLKSLERQIFWSQTYNVLLNARTSEHATRMMSMDKATENCNELVKNLTLKMNKLRQASITTELTEIISGANSQKS